MDPSYLDHLYLVGPSCRGCLTPVPVGRTTWCGYACRSFARTHPNDFRRIFRHCRACGIEIDHLSLRARFCSKSCSRQMVPSREAPIRQCEACGVDFRAFKGRPGVVTRWCSQACYAWTRRHPGASRAAVRACRQCSTDISDRPLQATYCSKRCGEIARGQRLPEPLPPRQCALPECGRDFQPHQHRQRCCSEKHGKLLYNRESRADGRQPPEPWTDARRDRYHRRRAQQKAASTGEPVLLADIAERDGWQCHICQVPVDQKIPWPDPKSSSLDHVVALSKGGLHDPSNVRLAHLGCNSSKGDRDWERIPG